MDGHVGKMDARVSGKTLWYNNNNNNTPHLCGSSTCTTKIHINSNSIVPQRSSNPTASVSSCCNFHHCSSAARPHATRSADSNLGDANIASYDFDFS